LQRAIFFGDTHARGLDDGVRSGVFMTYDGRAKIITKP
jgi:hypothetical protein